MKSYIDNSVRTMIDDYTKNPKRISSDFGKERESIEVYKGRELLELIQNADDELLVKMNKEVRISFINNVLTVSNNGAPFSEEGIDSLMYSNMSSKAQKKDVIGNKGTGFRSILGWAKEIRIKSGDLRIRFSDRHAQRMLSEILQNVKNIKEGTKYHSATLVFPEWIESENDSTYTTDISIHIQDDTTVINDINKQLNEIDGELLLFLNRTEELTVETKDRIVSFKKQCLSPEHIVIKKFINDEYAGQQKWLMNRKNGEFEGKYFSIVIAHNLENIKLKKQVLYSYFPTDVEFPFPVLLHANFNLNSDRNHLIKDDRANRFILEQASELLIDTAKKLTESEISYAPLLVLAPQKQISKELIDYDFDKVLMEKIKISKLFPTVNEKYISFEEKPKFYTSYLSQYLDGEGFDNLLIHTENTIICNLIKKLNNGHFPIYSVDYLVNAINKWSKSHDFNSRTMEIHAYCALGLLENYKNYRELKLQKKMPLLIYDLDGELVSNDTTVFLSDKNANISSPPKFAQIRFMHPEMRSIFEQLIKGNARKLATELFLFGVREYNTARIIDKMNNEIKKTLDLRGITASQKLCEEEMEWIWENRGILDNIGEKIKIYCITRNEKIVLSEKLYMGKEYGNLLCENLFEDIKEEKFINDIREYIDVEESSMQEVKKFLQVLGVEIFPRKKLRTFLLKKNINTNY